MKVGEDQIRLWSVQKIGAWERAQERGVLRGDGRRVDPYFKPAYLWLMDQMRERIPSYRGQYPIWAYTDFDKPDLRQRQFGGGGTRAVRLGFIANRADVLLSHRSSFDSVISGYFMALSEEEDDAFYGDSTDFSCWGWPDGPRRQQVIDSWQRILDLDLLAENEDWWGPAEHVQATIGEVTLDDVFDVKEFTSR